jgi:hypothetical protein
MDCVNAEMTDLE